VRLEDARRDERTSVATIVERARQLPISQSDLLDQSEPRFQPIRQSGHVQPRNYSLATYIVEAAIFNEARRERTRPTFSTLLAFRTSKRRNEEKYRQKWGVFDSAGGYTGRETCNAISRDEQAAFYTREKTRRRSPSAVTPLRLAERFLPGAVHAHVYPRSACMFSPTTYGNAPTSGGKNEPGARARSSACTRDVATIVHQGWSVKGCRALSLPRPPIRRLRSRRGAECAMRTWNARATTITTK